MIKIVDENLIDSNANFLIHQVNCQGEMQSKIATEISALYPHVEIEYRKYLRYCSKNNIKALGTVQFVPKDSWAVIMADTMKNENIIEYDKNYQYICNLFGQKDFGYDKEQYTNLKALKNGLYEVKNIADKLNASIAIPYGIGCNDGGGAKWNEVYKIIEKVFVDKTNILIVR